MTETIDLVPEPTSVVVARAFVERHAQHLPADLVEDAILLVSELVSNAVLHGEPDITLRVRLEPPGIGVEVQDGSDNPPRLPDGTPDLTASHGRGMFLVSSLATAWGVAPASTPPGKTVWFEIHPPSE